MFLYINCFVPDFLLQPILNSYTKTIAVLV